LAVAVGPDGATDSVRVIVPENPLKLVRVRVELPEEPAMRVRLFGFAAKEKSGAAPTVTPLDAVVLAPLVSDTVKVVVYVPAAE
jgi:hypothetical protein